MYATYGKYSCPGIQYDKQHLHRHKDKQAQKRLDLQGQIHLKRPPWWGISTLSVMMHLKWKRYKPWLRIKLFTLEDTLSLLLCSPLYGHHIGTLSCFIYHWSVQAEFFGVFLNPPCSSFWCKWWYGAAVIVSTLSWLKTLYVLCIYESIWRCVMFARSICFLRPM